jgi:hypothetical protein
MLFSSMKESMTLNRSAALEPAVTLEKQQINTIIF